MRARAVCLSLCLGLAGLGLVAPIGCGSKDSSEAVDVARTFATTARRGDVEGMLAVVERSAVERLELASERASDQVGGRRSIEASEMLQIVGVDRTVEVGDAELLEQSDRHARVELTMTDGRKLQLDLVWEQAIAGDDDSPARAGGWKVRLPLPEHALGAAPLPPDA